MNLTLNVPPEREAALKAHAQLRGLTVEEWFLQLAEQSAPSALPAPPADMDDRPIWEILVEEMRDVPAEDLAALPKDGASQIDHYIYGLPKR